MCDSELIPDRLFILTAKPNFLRGNNITAGGAVIKRILSSEVI